MANIKGLIIAAAVASGLALTGCSSEGSSACGNSNAMPTAVPAPVQMAPVAAPMPEMAGKDANNDGNDMPKPMKHRHHMKRKMHHKNMKMTKKTTTTETTTGSN